MERFQESGGKPIRFENRELHCTYDINATEGKPLAITFLRWVDRPVQGIGLTAIRCLMSVAGATAKQIALWTDTAPRQVQVSVLEAQPDAHILIVNQWRDEQHGTTMYHLNNAAMEVLPQEDDSLLFRCSDGWEEPEFNDLVFQVKGALPTQIS